MRYLHTMLRVRNLDQALDFYCNKLGLKEERRRVDEKGRYTLVFLAAPEDEGLVETSKKKSGRDAPLVELTYNWDSEDYGEARHFGHLAYEVDDIYATCEKLMRAGVTINRPPRDGMMAFVRSPDKHSIELLQKGEALPPKVKRPKADLGEQIAICQGFAMSRRYGWPMAIAREDISCPLAKAVWGFEPLTNYYMNGLTCAGMYTETPAAGVVSELAVDKWETHQWAGVVSARRLTAGSSRT